MDTENPPQVLPNGYVYSTKVPVIVDTLLDIPWISIFYEANFISYLVFFAGS